LLIAAVASRVHALVRRLFYIGFHTILPMILPKKPALETEELQG
jgi:hypothetical protein